MKTEFSSSVFGISFSAAGPRIRPVSHQTEMCPLQESQIRWLLILNREKRLVGIVSLGDLAVDAMDDQMAGEVLEDVSEPSKPQR